jgi:hypothetical protein
MQQHEVRQLVMGIQPLQLAAAAIRDQQKQRATVLRLCHYRQT